MKRAMLLTILVSMFGITISNAANLVDISAHIDTTTEMPLVNFTLDNTNSDVDKMTDSGRLTDTVTVTAEDGTTKNITIDIFSSLSKSSLFNQGINNFEFD